METKTIRTPHTVNAVFLFLLALGAVIFFWMYQYSEASENYCQKRYNWSVQWPIMPSIEKKCRKTWDDMTKNEVERFNDYFLKLQKYGTKNITK